MRKEIDEKGEEAMNSHRSISLMIEIKWKIHSIGMKMFVFPFFPSPELDTRKKKILTSSPCSQKLKIVSNSFP